MARSFFPPVQKASDDGLLMLGGELSAEWLLEAYRRGIFPWPIALAPPWHEPRQLAWWSPDPRAVMELNEFHCSRRLAQRIRSKTLRATCDQAFRQVMLGCAGPLKNDYGTWITPPLIEAYCELHRQGHAHSVEVWRGERLVGGVYGVSLGGMFAGESMFHRESDASKVALFHLVQHLAARGYVLFDIQQWTPHAGRLGAREIPRRQFLHRLEYALTLPVTFGDRLED
jgi:leucyl/phenylalanyl-tRNA--protein transferase